MMITLTYSSCKKDEDVKGCYVFTSTSITENYPPITGGIDPQTSVSSFTMCDLTNSEASDYSKQFSATVTGNGVRITTTCTYKKQ